jgi:selenocysteine lyase/cysteine desulfurase
MDLIAARACFPGTRDCVFLDAACVSLLPTQAATALADITQELLTCPSRDASAHHIKLDQSADRPRREAARLIGCAPADVALIESTTQGLQAVAATVPLGQGDRVLVGATEFMGLAVPWIPRQESQGFRLEVVPHRDGRLLVEDFARAVDGRTRMILLSSVQWNNGYRADLAAFSELARARNLVLVVDAIQQLGAVALDVGTTPVDFLVTGGHKWLNAPVGRGFLYVHPRWQERLRPAAWGYLNVCQPPEGWANYFATPAIPAVRDYEFHRDARAFEIGGTANYPGNAALGAALALVNELGIDNVTRYVVDLTEALIEGLRGAGATVVTPPARESRSGIVTFTLGQGVAADTAALQRLLDRRILVSQRYTAGVGGLRVSVHFFNNRDDIGRLTEAVRDR